MNAHIPHPGLKVLHVAQTAQGGVGSYLEEIMPAQAALYGADCVRAVLPAEHAAAFPGLLPKWLETFPAGAGRAAGTLRMAFVALRAVRRWRPQVVHLHSTFAGAALRPLLWLWGGAPAVIYCAHGWAFERRGAPAHLRVFRWLERGLSRLCRQVVCVSRMDYDRGRQAGIRGAKMTVVRNGIVDRAPAVARRVSPWPGPGLKVLFVGRLDPQKGVDVLLAAMRELGGRASALIVGCAVAEGDAPLDLPANVAAMGWLAREDIESLYAGADVLAMPSRWEGLPMVALEAMRAGLTVVAARVGGIPEAVEHGVTGLLVDPDSPTQLAAALASLDEHSRRRLGAHGRRRYEERFQVARVVGELDTLYRAQAAP
ncbi:glycosyltransferase [Ramlibacter sp. PS4R-6]|uniref:glycosyltransferase n=1 Tax=Ramlibacter sp. PS4R-6 TaxID=3133438 RepID=UPI0030A678AB